jgi:pimeloyl-ACP methyl ester carboxylesterase
MKKWMIFIILLLLAIEVLATLSEHSDRMLKNSAYLEWTSCWFTVPYSQTVYCGYFYPSDNQTAKKSQKNRLPVVILKNLKTAGTRQVISPILYLNGGPGVATGLDQEGIEDWWTWVEENEWPSDVVLFDQRGTGLSTPNLHCPKVQAMLRKSLDKSPSAKEEFQLWRQAVKECYQRLRQTGVDLSRYTTTNSSRDVGELMAALGGNNWNLYGVSYGTRLALTVVRDYPDQIRSVILDSVYPPEINDLLEFPFIYDNALTTLFKSCQTDSVCHATFPKLESSLFTLLEQLQQTPITLTVPNTTVGKPQKVVINDERFIEILFYALYSSETGQTLPGVITSARQGKYEPLKPLVENYVDWLLDKNFSHAVYWSVECHDRAPHTTRDDFLAKVTQFPRIRKFVEHQWDYDLCQVWKGGNAGDAFRTPVTSEIPTLFLAGEYDPVTPPLWAREAASHFKRGYFLTLPGIGHGVVNSDTCGSEVVREFLWSPFRKPQNECLYWPRDSTFVLDSQGNEIVAAERN